MKIKFQNLGSIKEAELDLRPLTVIIGPNNSNKTYIAYSVYGLWTRVQKPYVYFDTDSGFVEEIINFIQIPKIGAGQQHYLSLNIDRSFDKLIIRSIKDYSAIFSATGLETFFLDSSRKIFHKTKLEIEISENEIQTNINELCLSHEILFTKHNDITKIDLQDHRILFYSNKNITNNYGRKIAIDFTLYLLYFMFPYSLLLPAERNAFININKILYSQRYKVLKENQRDFFFNRNINADRQLDLLRFYPEPVEDFLDFLTEIELENKPDPDPQNKNQFQKLADQIEISIQNKNKTVFKKTKFGGREIKVSVKKGLEIDLYNASSSIKQLAPLLLYLRYRAKSGDFLVIDEPEMNLHPESQVKLLEALAILVNLGVRVLLTTHSPYLMAHLNNIVSGNHEDPELLSDQARSLYLQDPQAFLKMEQVSAYEMKDNQLISLHDPEYGIRWDTLSDVSVDVQQRFFKIYEAGQKKQNPEEGCTSEEE